MLATLLPALYTAQGLPYGFFTLALPVLLREGGWSLTAINLLQLLGLPWALKFLWAPWFDRVLRGGHSRLGRRGWLLVLMGVSSALALVAAGWCFLDGSERPLSIWALFLLVFLFNLLASTQDILTDGLAVRELDARQRGWANGVQVGAYRLGMILGGGGLLWLFSQLGWAWILLAMGAALALLTLPVWWWRDDAQPAAPATPSDAGCRMSWRQAVRVLWQRATQPAMRMSLALVICYRLGDQWVSSQIGPFLVDQRLDTATVALMKGTVGSVTSLMGALVGGWMLMRVPRRTAMLAAGLGQAATYVLYILVALGWLGVPWLWTAAVCEGLVSTLATVSLFAWMMDVADPEHAATDYTLMASVSAMVVGMGGLAGAMVGDWLGFATTFTVGTVLCVLGTLVMVGWQHRHPLHHRVLRAV